MRSIGLLITLFGIVIILFGFLLSKERDSITIMEDNSNEQWTRWDIHNQHMDLINTAIDRYLDSERRFIEDRDRLNYYSGAIHGLQQLRDSMMEKDK